MRHASVEERLRPIFEPASVAVIGASREPNKIGHVILRGFAKGFHGEIYPVNPSTDEILGRKCYKSVLDIPGEVDLATIAVPAKFVPKVLEDCGKKGVKGAIIVSGGFAEIGEKALEDETRRIADKYGIPVIGPNCLGVLDTHSNVDTLFLPRYKMARPQRGGISFISQSGAVGSIVIDWAAYRGFGVSRFVSYGNALNVDEVDLLEYLGHDKNTKVICAYLEGTRRGKEFIAVAKQVSCMKPIIAMKGGRSEAGSRAAGSHTGALAGSAMVWDAAFKQAGIIIAKDVEEMFDYARILAAEPLPRSNRTAIVTNGGGYGVLATDACADFKLDIAKLSDKTIATIKAKTPAYAVIKNPIDLVGDADSARYEVALNALMDDPNVDSIICIILFQTAGIGSEIVDVVAEINDRKKKPLVVASGGGEYALLHMKMLEENGVPTYDTLINAARALSGLTYYEGVKKSKMCQTPHK